MNGSFDVIMRFSKWWEISNGWRKTREISRECNFIHQVSCKFATKNIPIFSRFLVLMKTSWCKYCEKLWRWCHEKVNVSNGDQVPRASTFYANFETSIFVVLFLFPPWVSDVTICCIFRTFLCLQKQIHATWCVFSRSHFRSKTFLMFDVKLKILENRTFRTNFCF